MPDNSELNRGSAILSASPNKHSCPKPNFFIVGAPKSGTTALYSYLQQHPGVFMCRPKEPQFFAPDTCGNQRTVAQLDQYLACFAGANTSVIGEASTCYLSSPEAPLRIRQFAPHARIVILLRHPVDLMHAEHNERLTGGTEHVADFAEAIESSEPRFYRFGPFRGQAVIRPSYRELVDFGPQLRRYIEIFGRSQLHVALYDDFAKDTAQEYAAILRFLEVSTDQTCQFDVVNANRQIRSHAVHDLIADPPGGARAVLRKIVPKWMRRQIGAAFVRMNERTAPRAELNADLRRNLTASCAPTIRQLAEILDRDLSHWLAN